MVGGRIRRIENKGKKIGLYVVSEERIVLCAVFFFYLKGCEPCYHFFLLLTHKGTKSAQQYPSFYFLRVYIIVLGFSILKFESKIYAVSKCTNAISDFGINQLGEYYFFGSSWLASELVSTEMDI